MRAGRCRRAASTRLPATLLNALLFLSLVPTSTLLMIPTANAANAANADLPRPPDVARKPHVVRAPFGAERQDEYYWLRDDSRKDPAMLAYLGAENAYADALMAPLKPVQDRLYDEIVGRIKQDDSTVPYRERGWWYYARYEAGKDYPIHARRRDAAGMDPVAVQKLNDEGAPGEEVLFDVNAMAAGNGASNRSSRKASTSRPA